MDMIPFALQSLIDKYIPCLTIIGTYAKSEHRISNVVLLSLAVSLIDIAENFGGILVSPVYDLKDYPKYDLMFTLLFKSQSKLNEFEESLRKS